MNHVKSIRKEAYDSFRLYNIEADGIFEIPGDDTANIRVQIPAKEEYQLYLEAHGFFHADRMLKASINLKTSRINYEKMIRLDVGKTAVHKEEIMEIACNSFAVDRRFHVDKQCNPETAEQVVRAWVNRMEECYVCFYKGKAAGFAYVIERETDVYEICLAAVDERYRMSGAAVSLYAHLVCEYKKKGGKLLFGWISTVNTAVMNLYAALGAVFSEPSDIFLKERRK